MSVKSANQVQAQQNRLILFVLTKVYGIRHVYQCRAKMANRHCTCGAKIVNQNTTFFKHKL